MKAMQSRDGDDVCLIKPYFPVFDCSFHFFLVRQVNFIDNHDHPFAIFPELLQDFFMDKFFTDLRDKKDNICIGDGGIDRRKHCLMQQVMGFQNSGSIRINDLKIFAAEYSHDPVACGLSFMRYDGKLFPDQDIHQC